MRPHGLEGTLVMPVVELIGGALLFLFFAASVSGNQTESR
jgi:hypothetical protein